MREAIGVPDHFPEILQEDIQGETPATNPELAALCAQCGRSLIKEACPTAYTGPCPFQVFAPC